LFLVFPYSFLLPHKNMKINVVALSFIRFLSVFIPTLWKYLVFGNWMHEKYSLSV
jgi:hypothetical protein